MLALVLAFIANVALPSERLSGVVVDADLRPIGGVQLVQRRGVLDRPLGVADADGTFSVEASQLDGELRAWGNGVATLVGATLRHERALDDLRVIVAPSVSVHGRVVDPDGVAIPRALLFVEIPASERKRLTRPTDPVSLYARTARADEFGCFCVDDVPLVAGGVLRVECCYFQATRLPLSECVDRELEVVLARPDFGAWIEGQVIDRFGRPLQEAKIAFDGFPFSALDPGARFSFWTDGHELPGLSVVADGMRPARFDRPGSGRLVVVLDERPLTISGRVVDQDGQPVPFGEVWLEDATLVARGTSVDESTMLESGHTRPDESGWFVLSRLRERAYFVAWSPPVGVLTEPLARVLAFAGDSDVVLRVEHPSRNPRGPFKQIMIEPIELSRQPPPEPDQPVLVRVVDRDGHPLAGMRVEVPSAPSPNSGTTEANGIVQLMRYLEQPLTVEVTCEGWMAAHSTVPRGPQAEAHDVRMLRRAAFRLEGFDDRSGELYVSLGGHALYREGEARTYNGAILAALENGKSGRFYAAEGKHTLVVWQGDRLAIEREIELVADELTLVRP